MSQFQQYKTVIQHRNRDYEIAYFLRPGPMTPIFYLHGLGNSKKDFLGALSVNELKNYTLLALDYPGCGESFKYYNEVPLTVEDLAAITYKLAQFLQFEKIIIIGQSIGGLTGLLYALNYPNHLSALISVEGNLISQDCDVQSRDVFRMQFLGNEETFLARVEKRLYDPDRPGFEDFISKMRENIVDRAYFDYSRSLVDYSDDFPLLDQYIKLTIPSLYIFGSDNSGMPQLKVLRKAGKAVVGISGSDHFPTTTNPEEFYQTVCNFLMEIM